MTIESTRIVLVGCGRSKQKIPAPAWGLYTSPLFRFTLRYAQTLATLERIFVLSAQHGILPLDKVIDPYDRKLSDLGGKREREAWGVRAIDALLLQKGCPPRAERGELVALAGKDYTDAIRLPVRDAGFRMAEPMKGLVQGARMAWLKGKLAS